MFLSKLIGSMPTRHNQDDGRVGACPVYETRGHQLQLYSTQCLQMQFTPQEKDNGFFILTHMAAIKHLFLRASNQKLDKSIKLVISMSFYKESFFINSRIKFQESSLLKL